MEERFEVRDMGAVAGDGLRTPQGRSLKEVKRGSLRPASPLQWVPASESQEANLRNTDVQNANFLICDGKMQPSSEWPEYLLFRGLSPKNRGSQKPQSQLHLLNSDESK